MNATPPTREALTNKRRGRPLHGWLRTIGMTLMITHHGCRGAIRSGVTTATELTGGVTDNIKADGQANGIVKPNDL